MKEFDIVNQILEGLNQLPMASFNRINNVPTWNKKTQSYNRPSRFAPKGMSDICGCYKYPNDKHATYVAIEVKTPLEYNWVLQFYNRIKNNIDTYTPQTEKEKHVLNQIKYINHKIACDGIGFFTYSLEHCLDQLKRIS